MGHFGDALTVGRQKERTPVGQRMGFSHPVHSRVGGPAATDKENTVAIKPVAEMIAEARKRIDNHSPEEAKKRVDEEGALLVDVRDIRELERDGVIPGALHAPRGMLEFWIDPESPYFKEVFTEDREFVLY